MFKKFLIIMFSLLVFVPNVHAFWVWTPETNKWVNPKYAVKETPKEQLKYALDFKGSEDYKKAVKEFKKLIKHYPRAREAAEAQYFIGICYQQQELLIDAFKAYQVVVEKYPFSERSGEVVEKQYGIGNLILEGKVKRNKFVKTVVGGDYDVIEVFRSVIKNAPYGKYAAPSQYKIGLYLLEKKLYQEARDEFEKTLNDYPDTEWSKAAEYQIALSDAKRSSAAGYDQEVTKVAIAELEEFAKEHPDAEFSENARDQINELREKEAENNFTIAGFYEKQKKYEAAKTYYSTIVDEYNDTTWARKALEKIQKLSR